MVTDSATLRLRDLLEREVDDASERGAPFLRVAVRPGGCSGFSYQMTFDTVPETGDRTHVFGGDVTVAIDPSSAQLLFGATLDYRDGLDQGGFHITNPNAQRSCGCGQSFS
jgi:iron-sulfur cluster assembly protein/iron-sulfur cluster insertion protein